MQDNTAFIFFKPPHPPQAAPVCCEYKYDQNTQCAVNTLCFSVEPVPCEICCSQNLTFYWLWLKESGLRRWFQFHCPHVLSSMRCRYWTSLWCRWCIIAPQYVSAVPFNIATGWMLLLSLTGNVELVLVRHTHWHHYCFFTTSLILLLLTVVFLTCLGLNQVNAFKMNSSPLSRGSLMSFCGCLSLKFMCMHVFKEVFVFACWL